jgi:hypothetical protein
LAGLKAAAQALEARRREVIQALWLARSRAACRSWLRRPRRQRRPMCIPRAWL